jgi:uroporphyrinogen-III synthase
MGSRKNILVTGWLDESLKARLAETHDVDVVPFIRVEPVVSDEIKKALEELSGRQLHIVFTSNNGVQAVAEIIKNKPDGWQFFSMEGVTSRSVTEHFGEGSLIATAHTGEGLADKILASGDVHEVIFFCGDLRRDELPERLKTRGVNVKEMIVYHTIATPLALEKEYDAIVFFSPSAVYSYVSQNKIQSHAVCFAIGKTTANTIKTIVPNEVMIAQPPQKERVVEMLLEYYSKETKHEPIKE